MIDAEVCDLIRAAIEENPTHGVRMITAVVRRKAKQPVNRKKVHRIIKLNGWQVWRKPQGKRPRAQGWTSRSSKPNERWAVDATHVFCGRDGWCHLTAIIDCWDRNIVGWRLSKTGVAKIAAATLEDALRSRKIGLLLRTRPLSPVQFWRGTTSSARSGRCLHHPAELRHSLNHQG